MSVQTRKSDLDAYRRDEKLGEGTYGVVYKATEKKTGRIVALKKIKIDPHDEGIPATTMRELSLLNECQHPCVVELIKSLCVNGELYLVFEFMENDLKKYLDKLQHNYMSTRTLKSFSYQLIEGVRFIHARRVLHRDLKPQNLLVSDEGRLKLADFGLGREHGLPICKLTHEVVTLWYRPPEILLGQEKYSGAVDMWGIGCIMAEMATRHALFPGDCEIDELFQIFQILGTPNEKIWPGVTQLPDFKPTFPQWKPKDLNNILSNKLNKNGLDLLKKLLTYAPNKRITAKQALKHEWFDEIRDEMDKIFVPFQREQQQKYLLIQKQYQRLNQQQFNNNNQNNENRNPNINSKSSRNNRSNMNKGRNTGGRREHSTPMEMD